MNLLLIEPGELEGSRARITGPRAEHARLVLRVAVGRRLRVGVVGGPLGEGEVVRVDAAAVELALTLEAEVPPRPTLDVVLAVPRPKTLAKLVPDLVSMGVDRLFLIRTWKVEKPYLESPLLTPEGYLPLLRAGAMQGRLTHLPEVHVAPLFRPWIEDEAPQLFARAGVRWVLHPTAPGTPASVAPLPAAERAVVAIGPEAGFVDFEVERFAAAGFTPLSLGDRPLRVEVAAVATLAQLELLRALSATMGGPATHGA